MKDLRAKLELFNTKHIFKTGDIVEWKPGLCNKRPQGPFIVVEVLAEPVLNAADTGSPYFREPLDLVLGQVDSDGDFICYHYDSRRMQPARTMNIDDLTIGQAKELSAMFGVDKKTDNSAWEIGKGYLIRTVTMTNTGRIVGVTDQELILEDAAWIADTGRFSDSLKKCNFNEVEPFPDGKVIIGRGAIVDAVQVEVLPRSQK